MKFSDFQKRNDLCRKGQSQVLYCSGVGYIVKVGNRWYATTDSRLELVGVAPNHELSQPTVGPCKSSKEAFETYQAARGNG